MKTWQCRMILCEVSWNPNKWVFWCEQGTSAVTCVKLWQVNPCQKLVPQTSAPSNDQQRNSRRRHFSSQFMHQHLALWQQLLPIAAPQTALPYPMTTSPISPLKGPKPLLESVWFLFIHAVFPPPPFLPVAPVLEYLSKFTVYLKQEALWLCTGAVRRLSC